MADEGKRNHTEIGTMKNQTKEQKSENLINIAGTVERVYIMCVSVFKPKEKKNDSSSLTSPLREENNQTNQPL